MIQGPGFLETDGVQTGEREFISGPVCEGAASLKQQQRRMAALGYALGSAREGGVPISRQEEGGGAGIKGGCTARTGVRSYRRKPPNRGDAEENHTLTSSPLCQPSAGDLHWVSTDGRKPEGRRVCRWGPRATPIGLLGTQQSGEAGRRSRSSTKQLSSPTPLANRRVLYDVSDAFSTSESFPLSLSHVISHGKILKSNGSCVRDDFFSRAN